LHEAVAGGANYGVANEVLTMALSCILLFAPRVTAALARGRRRHAVDTLVHNFLHGPGSCRFDAVHAYGPACYQQGSCAEIIQAVADESMPGNSTHRSPSLPRFVQHAVWRYCSQLGLDICNGNR
jgi:hypothetical protein